MAKRKVTKKATSKSKATRGPSERSKAVAARNTKIAAAYNKGATVPELSTKFSLSTIMVYRYLKALGVTLRPRAAAKPKATPKPKLTPETRAGMQKAKAAKAKASKAKTAKPKARKTKTA